MEKKRRRRKPAPKPTPFAGIMGNTSVVKTGTGNATKARSTGSKVGMVAVALASAAIQSGGSQVLLEKLPFMNKEVSDEFGNTVQVPTQTKALVISGALLVLNILAMLARNAWLSVAGLAGAAAMAGDLGASGAQWLLSKWGGKSASTSDDEEEEETKGVGSSYDPIDDLGAVGYEDFAIDDPGTFGAIAFKELDEKETDIEITN